MSCVEYDDDEGGYDDDADDYYDDPPKGMVTEIISEYPFDTIKELLIRRTKISYLDAVKLTEELERLLEVH
jgi:hypothetical protein